MDAARANNHRESFVPVAGRLPLNAIELLEFSISIRSIRTIRTMLLHASLGLDKAQTPSTNSVPAVSHLFASRRYFPVRKATLPISRAALG